MIIWPLLILAVIFLSYWLAKRSMNDYLDNPLGDSGLFLIQNPREFSAQILESVVQPNQIFSLERLYKGNQKALVIFGSKQIILKHPELNPLELEDYTSKIDDNHLQAWELGLKKGVKEMKRLPADFFHSLQLNPSEQLYFQIVFDKSYQVTIRVAVVSLDSTKRATLSKQVEDLIERHSPLERKIRKLSSSQIWQSFKKRALYPKQIRKFILNPSAIRELLNY